MYSALDRWLTDAEFAGAMSVAKATDIAPGPGGSRITPVGAVHGLGFEPWSHRASVVALYPSAQLVAHCDPPVQGTRYHIPLVTNDGCWSFSGGVWQQLDVRRFYYMDPTELHGAVNWGTEVRLHLIVDVS